MKDKNNNEIPEPTNSEKLLEHLVVGQDEGHKTTHQLLENHLENQDDHSKTHEKLMGHQLEVQSEIRDNLKGEKMQDAFKGGDFIAALLTHIKGDKGDKGDTPEKGKDYFTPEELAQIKNDVALTPADLEKIRQNSMPVRGLHYFTDEDVSSMINDVRAMIPTPQDGRPGHTPTKGTDYWTEDDKSFLVKEILALVPPGRQGNPGRDGSPDTASQIINKIKGKLSYNDLLDLPTAFKQPKMAGTGYLREITDVSLSNLQDGEALVWQASTNKWINSSTAPGSGDVVGPSSATNNHVAFFNGTTGKLIKDSGLALSGANTGDQNIFASIAVSGQTTVTPGSTTQVLTFVAGSNLTITTDNTAKTITFAASGGGGGTVATVASADGSITVTGTTDIDLAVVKAPKLSTARTIGGVSFDGTANITVATATGGFTVSGGNLALGTNSLTLTGSIGATGARVTKVWATDITVTNAIAGDITGNAATVTTNANLTGPVTSSGNATSIASSIALPGSPTTTTQAPGDNSTKIATTGYVDAAVLGQDFKEAAKYATTTVLPTVVYSNGSSGVGATLTAAAFGALSFDGSTPSIGDRILVKNQASTFQNGIYTVTVVGGVATLFILTRATDFNQAFEIKTGDSTFVTSGSTLGTTTWAYTGVDSPTMGTDAITFAQVAGQGSFTAGNGITITGVSIAINTAVTVDLNTAQALTNKDMSSGTNTWPTFNQNTTGSAAKLTTARAIYGNNFDGSAALTQIIASTYGGTGNGFAKFSGPTTAEKTFTLPDASTTILTTNALVTVAQGGSGAGTLTGLLVGNGTSAFTAVTAPSGAVVGTTDTQTLTNKRITKRAISTTQSATPTINTDNTDVSHITGLAQAITSFTTNLSGTPVEGDTLRIDITDNGTARAITWGASFEASTVALPTTTVISTRLDVGFVWNSVTSKWRCVAVA